MFAYFLVMTGNFAQLEEKIDNLISISKSFEKEDVKKFMDSKILKSQSSSFKKAISAILYGLCSILIVFVNKILLTNLR